LEFFLTPSEKDHFAQWKEEVIDRSIVVKFVDPLFSFFVQYVPENVAPNAITLGGAVAILQAWYFCEVYHQNQSALVTGVSIVSLFVYWVSGRLDGKHAKKTMNDSSLGELFKYVCDLVSSIFLISVLCSLLLESSQDNMDTVWYCVQSVQIVLLIKHYSAFVREAGIRYLLIGPNEILAWIGGLLLVRMFFGLAWLRAIYDLTLGLCCSQFVTLFGLDKRGYVASMHPARAIWLTLMAAAIGRIYMSRAGSRKHQWTRNLLIVILVLRGISGHFRMEIAGDHGTDNKDVILDGLFLSMVTSDLIVAKMAGRELHWGVALMAAMVVMPHMQFVVLCFVAFYFLSTFADLLDHMNMPLLQVCRNVYCDGIYDLCHIGHKILFQRALKNGNRLFVGVVGDTDANNYKRPPVMSAFERENEVAFCRAVTKVIQNAPCFGLTEEFIIKNKIHVVCFGQEYAERFPDPNDDPYYKVPRLMGIAIPMPRSDGMSTSDLIKRIQDRGTDEKKTPGQ
jgi:choline-phosphate cytidylyltransferase